MDTLLYDNFLSLVKRELKSLLSQCSHFKYKCDCGELCEIQEQLKELLKVVENFESKTEPLLEVVDDFPEEDFLSLKKRG